MFVAIHWNGNIILRKCSLLAAPEVVKITTSSATSDENVMKMSVSLFVLYVDVDLCDTAPRQSYEVK